MKTRYLLLSCALILGGCANPGIVQMSPGVYMIAKSNGAGMFSNMPKMKANVVRQATEFAERQGKVVEPISMHDTVPTHGFPTVEYQFRLVDKPLGPTTP